MIMIRTVIEINEEKCNGCGLCAKACHEGAIGMVNGKACLLYTSIRRALLEQIECIAAEHHTSFNHVVVSMIEACLSEEDSTTEEAP